MHPFIHPLTGALDPVWEARSDWEIYKAIAKKFSEVAPEVLGVEQDVVLTPILHDTPAEIAQATDVRDWKRGECRPVPGPQPLQAHPSRPAHRRPAAAVRARAPPDRGLSRRALAAHGRRPVHRPSGGGAEVVGIDLPAPASLRVH
jgi:anaerobic selenocysteine-containing dehydrogenase